MALFSHPHNSASQVLGWVPGRSILTKYPWVSLMNLENMVFIIHLVTNLASVKTQGTNYGKWTETYQWQSRRLSSSPDFVSISCVNQLTPVFWAHFIIRIRRGEGVRNLKGIEELSVYSCVFSHLQANFKY